MLREPDYLHSLERLGPVDRVVDAGDVETSRFRDVSVRFRSLQPVRLPLSRRRALGELVEDVKVALVLDLAGDTVLGADLESQRGIAPIPTFSHADIPFRGGSW